MLSRGSLSIVISTDPSAKPAGSQAVLGVIAPKVTTGFSASTSIVTVS